MTSQDEKERCAEIEKIVKSIIFTDRTNSSKSTPSFKTSSPHETNPNSCKINVPMESNVLQSSELPQNNNESQLIDSEALMRFVSEHIQDSSETQFQGIENSLSTSSTRETSFTHGSHEENNSFFDSSIVEMSLANTSADDLFNKLWSKKKKKRRRGKVSKDKNDLKLGHRSLNETSESIGPAFTDNYTFDVNDGYAYSVSAADGREGTWYLECFICGFVETSHHMKHFLHFRHSNHEKNLKKFVKEHTLKNIPPPLTAQSEAISDLICKLHKEFGFSEHHLSERKLTWSKVNTLISENLSDCHVELIGSSLSGCGLRSSEIDMALIVNRQIAAERLEQCYELLLKSEFADVVCEFQDKIPKVTFTHKMTKCNIALLDIKSCPPIHSLLALYYQLDSRMPPLLTAFRYFAQMCYLDKPDLGTLPPVAFSLLLIYFLQRQNPPVLPVLQEIPDFDVNNNCENFLSTFNWCSKNTDSVGLLWVNLLKFCRFEYKPGDEIVSIRTSKMVLCKDKGWGTKFLAIEDPIEQSRNISHTIPNKALFTYILDVFMHGYEYFAYPQLTSNDFKIDIVKENAGSRNSSFHHNDVLSELTETTDESAYVLEEFMDGHDEDLPLDDVISTISKLTIDDIKIDEDNDIDDDEDCAYNSRFCNDSVSSLFDEQNKENFDIVNAAKRFYKNIWNTNGNVVTKDMFNYEFKEEIFFAKENMPVICRSCGLDGHVKKDCPEDKLPSIIELPRLSVENLDSLSEVCIRVKKRLSPSHKTIYENEEERTLLESIIRDTYKDAQLTLFGSFCNGFGFENSDLDFCLTFKNNKTGEGLVFPDIIQNLAKKFENISFLRNVTPIVSAKVPILKFVSIRRAQHYDCDISLYNTLAQHNTKMLQTYCAIDDRVQIIGYVIKRFAKELDICDASKGSLSSYAYILMAIYYLQQCKPPVIPVLQELYTGEKPVHMVDDWNVWFFDDISKLKDVWPFFGKNVRSISELWLGLLNFYAFEFDFANNVIAIKQKKHLPRFKKLWQSKKIAIEDPFDLNHNLGTGLSRKMSNYIRRSFINGREHFGSPCPDSYLFDSSKLMRYYFDARVISKGIKPPQDRLCRGCKKIGHFLKDCPRNPKNRKSQGKFLPQNKEFDHKKSPQKTFKELQNKNRNSRQGNDHHYQNHHHQHKKSEAFTSASPYAESSRGSTASSKGQTRQKAPPGFNSNYNFMMQSTIPYATRPMTSSPFPAASVNVNNSSVKQSRMPHPNNPNLWPAVHARSDNNYRLPNNSNHIWQAFPIQNHKADQVNHRHLHLSALLQNAVDKATPPDQYQAHPNKARR